VLLEMEGRAALVVSFARAYGMPPREWRREASRVFFLAAPSGVHFQPPAGLRLPARRNVSGMDVLVRMVEHQVWLTGELIERGARLDAATLDRPIELPVEGIDDDISIRYLLDRLVWQEEMWLASVEDRPFQVPECGAADRATGNGSSAHGMSGAATAGGGGSLAQGMTGAGAGCDGEPVSRSSPHGSVVFGPVGPAGLLGAVAGCAVRSWVAGGWSGRCGGWSGWCGGWYWFRGMRPGSAQAGRVTWTTSSMIWMSQ
jgi:hypothetical protein